MAKGVRKSRSGAASGDLAPRLERVFAAILEQVRRDPSFAQRIANAFGEATAAAPSPSPSPSELTREVASAPPPTSSRLPPPPPPPPKRQKALIDPFALYETGWEAMLRSHLERLDVEQLRDVIHQYKMDSAGRTASLTDIEELRSFIIHAVENFGMS